MAEAFQTPAFRQAGPGDLDTLFSMVRALYVLDGHETVSEETSRRALAEVLAGGPYAKAWLIEVNKQPIGYFLLTFGFSLEAGGKDAILDELYLEEEWRGLGCGKAALIQAEEMARAEGCVALSLFVEHHNETARAIYEAKGFIRRTWDHMEKKLD